MLDDPLDPEVAPDECISRFIFLAGQFNPRNRRVRPGVFKLPETTPDQGIQQRSVYRTKDCTEEEIWYLSDEYVTKNMVDEKFSLARADLQAVEITEEDLKIVPHPYPHPRHANIENWPNEEELRELKAVALASKARLVIRPTSS